MRERAELYELHDDVRTAGVLDRLTVNLLGFPVELRAYFRLLGILGVGGYRDESLGRSGAVDYGEDHYTCFQFDYDWRRDIVENAQRLHEFILTKRRYVQDERKNRFGATNGDVKFDIVAHSMGGLVARYFLRYGSADLPADGSIAPVTWAGARSVDRAILVGTPNAGSVNALLQLVKGAKYAPILPTYPPALIGTMPSVYQLLPRSRHRVVVNLNNVDEPIADILDPELWVRLGWGLASYEQERVLRTLLPDESDVTVRRRIALEHQRKCLKRAKQLHAALDTQAVPPESLRLYLFAGDAEHTNEVVGVDLNTGDVRVVKSGLGDGTVLRASALMDERVGGLWQPRLVSPIEWTQVSFLFTDHLGMTKDPAFYDNVLFLLLESQR